ncbi:MAG: hypothetical protein N2Z22_01225 [Turneriella sp.]|nr:hypothetical protein [Leptospiraceae bacterium]MCX7631934.1 hypothetical protein [Turneriella sp.]
MILYTTWLPSRHAGYNLALEETFLTAAKPEGHAWLFFYENQDAIILGKSQVLEEEVYPHKGPAVFRRISGGGAVLHTQGNLNYALFLSLAEFPQLTHISQSYRILLSPLAQGLGKGVTVCGSSDLAVYCRGQLCKISGNAQCRRRGFLLQHGTLLYCKKAVRRVSYYLRMPAKIPDYRKARRHREFLSPVLPSYSRAVLMRCVRHAFASFLSAELRTVPFWQLLQKPINPFPAERSLR